MDMKPIKDIQLDRVSFPDCEVTFFEMTPFNLRLQLNGIYIEDQGFVDLPIYVRISDWNLASCEQFDANGANPIEAKLDQSEGLREICEWEFTDNTLKIAGFSCKSGGWEQLCFLDPKVEIQVDE